MSERILLTVVVVLAILGAIPQAADAIPSGTLPAALVILGLVMGLTGATGGDASQRTAIYVLAAALPSIADSLDVIPVVGSVVNGVLDNVAVSIQGLAIGLVLLQLKDRLLPDA